MIRAIVLLLLLVGPLVVIAGPAAAVEPDEMLADPELEARARALSEGLRCLICRNESIDDSNAMIARDLRLMLRERLTAGDTDDEALAFIVDRYGEYVLLNPTKGGANLILWLTGPALLLIGGALAFGYTRQRGRADDAVAPLTPPEQARVDELMKRQG
jgi:cytochrome c-type biogenesis protein CcmH